MGTRKGILIVAASLVIVSLAAGGWFGVKVLASNLLGEDSPLVLALGVIPALTVFVAGLAWLSGRGDG